MFCFFGFLVFHRHYCCLVTKHANLYYGVNFNASLCIRIGRRFHPLVDIETVCQSHNHVTGPQRKSEKKEKN